MTTIEKAIAESREREKKATPVVAWYSHGYECQVRGPYNRWFQCSPEQEEMQRGRIVRARAADDVEFCAGAMNNEPRFRDALEVAVAGMEAEIRRAGGRIPILKKTLEEISRILSGAAEVGEEKK